jgi:hypothetical protein
LENTCPARRCIKKRFNGISIALLILTEVWRLDKKIERENVRTTRLEEKLKERQKNRKMKDGHNSNTNKLTSPI